MPGRRLAAAARRAARRSATAASRRRASISASLSSGRPAGAPPAAAITRSNVCWARSNWRWIRRSSRPVVVLGEAGLPARGLEGGELFLHLLLARGQLGDAGVEAAFLLGRFGPHRIEAPELGLEVELAGQRRFGEVVATLAEREARFLVEIGEALAYPGLAPSGLGGAIDGRLLLDPDLVERAIDLADRLAHHAAAAGALERVDAILGGRREQAPHAKKDRFRHCFDPLFVADTPGPIALKSALKRAGRRVWRRARQRPKAGPPAEGIESCRSAIAPRAITASPPI